MSTAISIVSGAAPWMPFAGVGHHLAAFWRDLTRDAVRSYRPEKHYMRGRGPAWRAKHGIA
jgi:hypothetical protein